MNKPVLPISGIASQFVMQFSLIMHARSNAAVKTDASQHPCEVWWLDRGKERRQTAASHWVQARLCSNIRWLHWLAKIQCFTQIASLSLRVI